MAEMAVLGVVVTKIFFAAQPWWAAILQNTNNHHKTIISVSIDLYVFGQILDSHPNFLLPVRLWFLMRS